MNKRRFAEEIKKWIQVGGDIHHMQAQQQLQGYLLDYATDIPQAEALTFVQISFTYKIPTTIASGNATNISSMKTSTRSLGMLGETIVAVWGSVLNQNIQGFGQTSQQRPTVSNSQPQVVQKKSSIPSENEVIDVTQSLREKLELPFGFLPPRFSVLTPAQISTAYRKMKHSGFPMKEGEGVIVFPWKSQKDSKKELILTSQRLLLLKPDPVILELHHIDEVKQPAGLSDGWHHNLKLVLNGSEKIFPGYMNIRPHLLYLLNKRSWEQ